MRSAAIGIGSNSLRMLVADVQDGKLAHKKRYREGLRMFAALDEQNCISDEMIAQACSKLQEFCKQAREDGAEEIFIFATSAVRDCRNQEAFSKAIQDSTGYSLDICDGEKEASLSYWGAVRGDSCALIDIGGGSTEIIFGHGMEIDFAYSFQMGAVRLYREVSLSSMEDAMELKDRLVKQMRSVIPSSPPEIQWVGVGGTFTTSVALITKTDWRSRKNVDGFRLCRNDIEKAIAELVVLPIEERLKLPYFQPQRADIIVHGLVILLACFDSWNIPDLLVSESGNLEGYLIHQYS